MAASASADAACLIGHKSESLVANGIICAESPRIGCIEITVVGFAKAVVPFTIGRICGNKVVARVANWNRSWPVRWHGCGAIGWASRWLAGRILSWVTSWRRCWGVRWVISWHVGRIQ